ncbi:MAG: hypothetical protein FJ276_36280 [Planctomycetes bacterium]|nr:hypothetical protein [Planctomycetota bacterium]
MRHDFSSECFELRARIARSRRRVDRAVCALTSGPLRGLRWAWGGGVVLAAGFSLARRFLRGRRSGARPRSAADWFDRLLRRLRVFVWQYRRANGRAERETGDE